VPPCSRHTPAGRGRCCCNFHSGITHRQADLASQGKLISGTCQPALGFVLVRDTVGHCYHCQSHAVSAVLNQVSTSVLPALQLCRLSGRRLQPATLARLGQRSVAVVECYARYKGGRGPP
jgi:hypothetical protein